MTEERKLNIYQRLNAIMNDVKYIQKEEKKVNNQYRFVSHDAVVNACRPSFIKHGVAVIPTVSEYSRDGNMTLFKISVDFVNIDNPDDRFTSVSYGQGIDNQDKGVGKAYSYAYKYVLLKVLGLETGDDPERDSIEHKVASLPSLTPTPEEKMERVIMFIEQQQDIIDLADTPEKVESVFTLNPQNVKWFKKIKESYPLQYKQIRDFADDKKEFLKNELGVQ